MKTVLDSRFIMELFYSASDEIKQKTSRKIREMIQRKEGVLPTIVISEIVHTVCGQLGKEEAEMCYANLVQGGLKIQALTPQIAKKAGILRCKYRSVPMGDCIIAATAITNQAAVLSDDPHFEAICETKRIWI
ncbi:MAG: PIN domain-containing protein [Candidatus Bathyarchaeota archaeon]|nr:PIN domain-containing protein [Candidatus Bathyarchaeota archaeon]MDT8782417.1 PIN domain-containing protein [Candidatus Bathyarchaeota archaeon]